MTDPPNNAPKAAPPEPAAPSLHDVDERWTIPWALVEEGPASGEGVALVWHGPDDAFAHAGYTIERPMLYSADGPPTDPEASCIDTTLPVGEPDFEAAPPLPHWATYATLTRQQRVNYLQWLASGRATPLADTNYVFLYFYGLERHALIDRGDPEDVLRELMRLLKHYDGAPSFFSCASRLAAFLFATKGIEKLKPAWFDRLFVNRAIPLHPDSVSVALTWLYERGKPLPAALAFEVARQDLRCPHGAAFRDDPDAFEARFAAAYTERFGEGMMLQRAEKAQTWKYRPINPSLQSWEHFAKLWSVTSTDVAAEGAQFAPLVAIWRECAGMDAETPGDPWVVLVDEHINAEGRVLVPVRKLAALADVAVANKSRLDLAESHAITEAAAAAGFEVLPNPRLLLRPYKWKERVALVRRPGSPQPESEPYYLAGALLLALGTAMAAADGDVDPIEVLHVSEIVNSLYHFNDYDKHRLGVLRKRLLKFPPRMTNLTRRVRAILSEDERAEVCTFLAGVAGADYRIEEAERRALRRACRAFNVPVKELDAILAGLVGEPDPDGRRPIDQKALAGLMRETKAFAARLGVAMQELQAADAKAGRRGVWFTREPSADRAAPSEHAPDPYREALYALLQRPGWTEAEFIALGEKHGVFKPGAVRLSDDWAEDMAGSGASRLRLSSINEGDQ